MAYRANPFLERTSEKTTSDQEFVRLFSPKVLERLPEDVFAGALHIFRSPPGCGKTTLLRSFTPTALKAFWNARRSQDMNESYQRLLSRGVLDEHDGPELLGVLLSCASGYSDLPPGATFVQEGLFRALLDCRVVLRSLRSLALLLGFGSSEELEAVHLSYEAPATDLKHIPLVASAADLARWAEQRERSVYLQLDSLKGPLADDIPSHVRFESVLWLQGVRFIRDERPIRLRRLLMIDDVQHLRRKQRSMLINELAELRPEIPVWLAERSIVLGDELLSQGVRDGRDIRQYPLEEIWTTGSQQQFTGFAQNVLDRRLDLQTQIPPGSFSLYLRSQIGSDEFASEVREGLDRLAVELAPYRSNSRYTEWLAQADRQAADADLESLRDLYVTRILLARDQAKRQLALDLAPLAAEELEERDSSQVQAAAAIFMHEELRIPHYFGIDRLCAMATGNIDEVLALAAALYDGLLAKRVLRRADPYLSPGDQEKLIVGFAKKRRDFIPRHHTEGTRAQRLLDAIGEFCRGRTFLPNAPYAPGVTGVRLSQTELSKLTSSMGAIGEYHATLRTVLAECVAENLLVARASSASSSRDSGTVYYLNRTICALYGLPLQMGGWQDVRADELIDWMGPNRATRRQPRLEIR